MIDEGQELGSPYFGQREGRQTTWVDFHLRQIAGRTPEELVRKKTAYKARLLTRLMQYVGSGAVLEVLEAGCGTGTSLVELRNRGCRVVGVDRDQATIALARTLFDLSFYVADIGRLPFRSQSFDVCFSNGVLEHFEDEQIRKYIIEQLLVAHTVVVSVPSRQYRDEERTYGDERFMTHAQWQGILSPVSTIIKSFGFHCRPTLRQRVLAPFDIDQYQFLVFILNGFESART